MADVHTKETRSYNMSRIKGKNTKPEMLVRKFLHANGYRYKLHDKTLPGKPDTMTITTINGVLLGIQSYTINRKGILIQGKFFLGVAATFRTIEVLYSNK
jgi:DNA mismatch endonuclease Vsr